MKIYLADTIQRDNLGYNIKFPVKNHLESYFAIERKKERIELWSIFERRSNENKNKRIA